MKRIRVFLAAVLTLSLVTGYILPVTGGSERMPMTASAATKKTITIKVNSDFILKLPADWENNYVRKNGDNEADGYLVALYSKKCYKQTKGGWLFSVVRYPDDSYTDLPFYELVGRWDGMNYVAVFSTDTETMGVTKAAKRQYHKMFYHSLEAACSIQPVKKTRKGVCRTSAFSLKLPAGWKNNYIVKKTGKSRKDISVSFYAKKCHEQTGEGYLFSISAYEDDSYQELPAYELVGMWDGISYVAVFPTDVQFVGVSKDAATQYRKLDKSVKKVARTIQR